MIKSQISLSRGTKFTYTFHSAISTCQRGLSNLNIGYVTQNLLSTKAIHNQELKVLQEKLLEKEKSLKQKEIELEQQKQDNETYREELKKEYQTLVKEVRDIGLGIELTEEDSIQDLRILIFGKCKLNSDEIFEIFNKQFFQIFGENLEKKCLEANLLDYNSIKNSNINKKIKQDKYDYIIVGQQPHSSRAKNSKHSYRKFKEVNGLKAIINEDYDKCLNKEKLSELANTIILDWENQFENIE